MKVFYLLIPLFMVNACKTPTGPVISSEKTSMEQIGKSSVCPEDGTCEVVVHKNKKLEIVEDGTMATIYPRIVDGKSMVVEFTYLKPGPEGTADGNYSETIYFELPADTQNLVKENDALGDVKMLFGKQGFRNSGYYPVTDGKLVLNRRDNTLNINLNFKVEKTSQIITSIKESVKI